MFKIVAAFILAMGFVAPGSNPYCGMAAVDFAPPGVICQDGFEMDSLCREACEVTYQQRMVEIYDTACVAWDIADGVYDTCIYTATLAYDQCMATAQNSTQKMACRTAMLSAIDDCTNILNGKRVRISGTLSGSITVAKGEYTACAKTCCVPENP